MSTLIIGCASRGHSKIVTALISKNADVNNKKNIGNSALMLSVIAEDEASVKLLLDAGTDINIRNNKREQAINLAELVEDETIVELIRKREKEKKLFGIF